MHLTSLRMLRWAMPVLLSLLAVFPASPASAQSPSSTTAPVLPPTPFYTDYTSNFHVTNNPISTPDYLIPYSRGLPGSIQLGISYLGDIQDTFTFAFLPPSLLLTSLLPFCSTALNTPVVFNASTLHQCNYTASWPSSFRGGTIQLVYTPQAPGLYQVSVYGVFSASSSSTAPLPSPTTSKGVSSSSSTGLASYYPCIPTYPQMPPTPQNLSLILGNSTLSSGVVYSATSTLISDFPYFLDISIAWQSVGHPSNNGVCYCQSLLPGRPAQDCGELLSQTSYVTNESTALVYPFALVNTPPTYALYNWTVRMLCDYTYDSGGYQVWTATLNVHGGPDPPALYPTCPSSSSSSTRALTSTPPSSSTSSPRSTAVVSFSTSSLPTPCIPAGPQKPLPYYLNVPLGASFYDTGIIYSLTSTLITNYAYLLSLSLAWRDEGHPVDVGSCSCAYNFTGQPSQPCGSLTSVPYTQAISGGVALNATLLYPSASYQLVDWTLQLSCQLTWNASYGFQEWFADGITVTGGPTLGVTPPCPSASSSSAQLSSGMALSSAPASVSSSLSQGSFTVASTASTPSSITSTASLCFLFYSLRGTIDYPFSIAYSLTVTYTSPSAGAGAVLLTSGSGRRTYTNRFGAAVTTPLTLLLNGPFPPGLYLNQSYTTLLTPLLPLGLTFNLTSPIQLPGINPLLHTSQTSLFGSTSIAELSTLGSTALLDIDGQAWVSSIPGFINHTIGASNFNALAVDYDGCQAPITFTNGLRPPTQPSVSNGGVHVAYTYSISDGVTYSVHAELRVTMMSAFATAMDTLGNPYQTVVNVTGMRVYTHLPTNATLVSQVIGVNTSANTQPRFYPYALLVSSPGVYSVNSAPFLDANGLTYEVSPAVPVVGQALDGGGGGLSGSVTVAIPRPVDGAATAVVLAETPVVVTSNGSNAPLAALQTQSYTIV